MSSPGLPTLTLDVAARRGERAVVATTLLILSLAIYQWSLPAPVLVIAGAGACVATIAGFAMLGWLAGHRRLARIVCGPDGRWTLCEAGGTVTESALSNASRVSTRALWLCWTARSGKPLLLVRGDIPDVDFRRLVVRLRVAGLPVGDEH
jgi:hypothetical protein